MSLFCSALVLCSPIDGVVLRDGQPAVGIEVKQRIFWGNEVIESSTVTDESGEFSFDVVSLDSLFWRFFPHHPAISQSIMLHDGNKEHRAWKYQKGNYEYNGEVGGKPLVMRCDLVKKEKKHPINEYNFYYGLCEIQ